MHETSVPFMNAQIERKTRNVFRVLVKSNGSTKQRICFGKKRGKSIHLYRMERLISK